MSGSCPSVRADAPAARRDPEPVPREREAARARTHLLHEDLHTHPHRRYTRNLGCKILAQRSLNYWWQATSKSTYIFFNEIYYLSSGRFAPRFYRPI